jgi:hypothetical protein
MAPGQGSPCNAGAGATSRWHETEIGGAVGEDDALEAGRDVGDVAGEREGFSVGVQAARINTAAVA